MFLLEFPRISDNLDGRIYAFLIKTTAYADKVGIFSAYMRIAEKRIRILHLKTKTKNLPHMLLKKGSYMRNVRICGYDRPRMRKLLTNFCIYGYFIVANVNISFSEMRNFFPLCGRKSHIFSAFANFFSAAYKRRIYDRPNSELCEFAWTL